MQGLQKLLAYLRANQNIFGKEEIQSPRWSAGVGVECWRGAMRNVTAVWGLPRALSYRVLQDHRSALPQPILPSPEAAWHTLCSFPDPWRRRSRVRVKWLLSSSFLSLPSNSLNKLL
jgi:hypothetical protein